MDPVFCNASVDFNVPGKPNPPPIKLTATVWTQSYRMSTGKIDKYAIEFTDPSGTLALPSAPLNTWVQLEHFDSMVNPNVAPATGPKNCIKGTPLVFKDMHDGDTKQVTLRGDKITIKPSNRDERLSASLSAMPYRGSVLQHLFFCF